MKRTALLIALPIALTVAGALPLAAQKVMKPKSNSEIQALQALFGAQTPDAKIKAADDLITKFADTDYKSVALQAEADAYEQKQMHDKAIVYAEQAIEADPKNFDAMTLLANVYSQTTRDADLDKAEKLTKADKYANDAIAVLKDAPNPNPTQMKEEQWAQYRHSAESQAYQAMGNTNVVRKKWDDAQKDYQKAIELFPDPYTMIRAGRASITAGKSEEAVAWFDKALASPNADANVKQIATQDKARAAAMKK